MIMWLMLKLLATTKTQPIYSCMYGHNHHHRTTERS